MDTLFEHPHLLDSALGRAAAYLAIAILFGLVIWEYWLKTHIIYGRYYRWCALFLGLFGLLIAINSTVLEVSNPFDADDMGLPKLVTVFELLQNTNFGKAWLSYAALLFFAVFSRTLSFRGLALAGMLGALVFSSHAGEEGLLRAAFWVDYFHLLFALSWLGGLTVLIALRLSKKSVIQVDGLQFFSRMALPVFILILASGMMQIILRIVQEQILNSGYITVLGIKLILVTAIILSAWGLRRHLKRDNLNAAAFDNGLSLEFFFAMVLILVTGLLTQIAPG